MNKLSCTSFTAALACVLELGGLEHCAALLWARVPCLIVPLCLNRTMKSETGKPTVAAATTEISKNSSSVGRDAQRPDQNIKGAIYAIVCGVVLPCIPVIVISAVLLCIIFKHRIVPQPGWPELYATRDQQKLENITSWISEIRHQGGKPAYYVAYNQSTITTIAAWTGRVIPHLSSSIMPLVDFLAARHMAHKSKHGNNSDLPTPEQLTISSASLVVVALNHWRTCSSADMAGKRNLSLRSPQLSLPWPSLVL
jgi:hypothetical protein